MLPTEKVTMSTKYSDFANIFLEKVADVFPEQSGANEHPIELEKGKQPPYGPIYSLGPVEFEILKTYIETNLGNGFIWASKLSVDALILFVRKPNSNLCLCINCWGFNNLTIKNRYLLPLIGKFLDQIDQAKWFT